MRASEPTTDGRAGADRDDVARLVAAPARHGVAPQPIVRLTDGVVVAYEAHARFAPDEFVSDCTPGEWFARAHRTGLGPQLELAAASAALALPDRPAGTRLVVKLGPATLLSDVASMLLPGDLSGVVVKVADRPLSAEELELLRERAERLRVRGALIAVESAGLGSAGHDQVLALRPDVISLGRSLTRGIASDPVRIALVEALVGFAQRTGAVLGMQGIETLDDLRVLADLDVPWGQGHVLAPPAPGWPRPRAEAHERLLVATREAMRGGVANEVGAASGEVTAFAELCLRLHQAPTMREIATLLPRMARHIGADEVAVSLIEIDGGVIRTLTRGSGTDAIEVERFELADFPATQDVLAADDAMEIVVGRRGGDPAELALLRRLGYGALLMVPVRCGGRPVGLIEAYRRPPEGWPRRSIGMCRMLGLHLAPVLQSLGDDQTV